MIVDPNRLRTSADTLVELCGRTVGAGSPGTIDLAHHTDVGDVVARAEAWADAGAPAVLLLAAPAGSDLLVEGVVAGLAAVGLSPHVAEA